MATRTSLLRYLAAGLVAGLAFSLAPTAPVRADDDPGVRTKRVRTTAPRVRVMAPRYVAPQVRTVVQVRTVERVRTRVVCYDYTGQPFDCRGPAPVAQQPAPQPVVYYTAAPTTTCGGCAQTYAPPAQYYPVQRHYGTGCGGCAQTATYNGYTGYSGHTGYTGAYYGGGAQYYRAAPYHRAAPYRWAVRHAQIGYRQAARQASHHRHGHY